MGVTFLNVVAGCVQPFMETCWLLAVASVSRIIPPCYKTKMFHEWFEELNKFVVQT